MHSFGFALITTLFVTGTWRYRMVPELSEGSLASITIVRPENNGSMNVVPCWVTVDRGSDIVSVAVSRGGEQLQAAKWSKQGIRLVGGDSAVLSVRRTIFSLSATTPVTDEPPGFLGEQKLHVWRSTVLKVSVSDGKSVRVVVEPTSKGPGYDGGWRIRTLDSDEAVGAPRGNGIASAHPE